MLKADFRFSQRHNLSSKLSQYNQRALSLAHERIQKVKTYERTMSKHTTEYVPNTSISHGGQSSEEGLGKDLKDNHLTKGKFSHFTKRVVYFKNNSIKNQSKHTSIQRIDEDNNSELLDQDLDSIEKSQGEEEGAEDSEEGDVELTGEKKRLLFSVMLSLFMIQTISMNVETIMPTYVASYHSTLSEFNIAIILVAFQIAGVLFSPFLSFLFKLFGRRKSMFAGYSIITLASIGIALTEYIADDTAFFITAICARFVQGLGDVWIQTACYAIITFKFAGNRERFLGYGEAAAGLGLMIGPVIGSYLNVFLGYFWAFFIFAMLLVVSMITCFFMLPTNLNENNIVEDESERTMSIAKAKEVPYTWFLLNKRSLFGYLSCTVVCFMYQFPSSFLTIVLVSEKGIPTTYHGLIIATPALFYVACTFLYSYVSDKLPRRVFILISFILLTVAIFLLGPSYLLSFPQDSFIMFIIGYALLGAAQGLIFIPILPEVIDSVYLKQGIKEGEDEALDGIISDKSAALYGFFLAMGLIAGPIAGSLIYEETGNFNRTCDYFAVGCAGYTIIYLVFNVICNISTDKKEQQFLEKQLYDVVQNKYLSSIEEKEGEEGTFIGSTVMTLRIDDQK